MIAQGTNPRKISDDVNSIIQSMSANGSISTNDIGDGYHTFGQLYDHRTKLYIALASQNGNAWRSLAHSDGSVWDGWFILGINKKAGEQITYHLPTSEWDNCKFAETLDKAPEWDGHSSDDVLERIQKLLIM